jgi:predicted transcriptional regulator
LLDDQGWETIGRRSRLDIACEILRVISEGTEKPTRIIQKANLSWKGLLLYLEALTRNQLVTRKVEGSRAVYMVTPKGISILGLYTRLREEVAALELGTLSYAQVSEALKEGPKVPLEASVASELSGKLAAAGYELVDNKVTGRSGVTHTFSMVARDKEGGLQGYDLMGTVDERSVITSFIKQLDTDVAMHIIATGDISPKAKKLALDYSMSLTSTPEP